MTSLETIREQVLSNYLKDRERQIRQDKALEINLWEEEKRTRQMWAATNQIDSLDNYDLLEVLYRNPELLRTSYNTDPSEATTTIQDAVRAALSSEVIDALAVKEAELFKVEQAQREVEAAQQLANSTVRQGLPRAEKTKGLRRYLEPQSQKALDYGLDRERDIREIQERNRLEREALQRMR
jgi:hypothetical protein